MTLPSSSAAPSDGTEETLPTFSEQVASQLGGLRGMVESSIPVIAFVAVNIVWGLTPALIVAVVIAVGISVYRLARKESIRHAMNGLVGIAIGAIIAWKTGTPQGFYIPGILLSLGYGLAMAGSIVFRRPLVGWLWSLVADQGATRWRDDSGLRRIFGWLTALWAATYLVKVVVNVAVFYAAGLTDDQKATILGVMRIVLGAPPYALLVALTAWAARRYLRSRSVEPATV
jgi:hypothetical protein